MAILRLVLNTAGVWWIGGGIALMLPVVNSGAPSWAVGTFSFLWMFGIIPAVVLSGKSSENPKEDLRAALAASKAYALCMGIIVVLALVMGIVLLPFWLS